MLLFAEAGDRAAALNCNSTNAAVKPPNSTPSRRLKRSNCVTGSSPVMCVLPVDAPVPTTQPGDGVPSEQHGFLGSPMRPPALWVVPTGRVRGSWRFDVSRLLTIVRPGAWSKTPGASKRRAGWPLLPTAHGSSIWRPSPQWRRCRPPFARWRRPAPATPTPWSGCRLAGRGRCSSSTTSSTRLAAEYMMQVLAGAGCQHPWVTARLCNCNREAAARWPTAPACTLAIWRPAWTDRRTSTGATSWWIQAYDATHLFLQSVRRQTPDFQPGRQATIASPTSAACSGQRTAGHRVGGFLEAAAVVGTLAHGWRTVCAGWHPPHRDAARHRSMVAVFDHSWQLLDARANGSQRTPSLFRGFTLEAAETVALASVGIWPACSTLRGFALRPLSPLRHWVIAPILQASRDPAADGRSRYALPSLATSSPADGDELQQRCVE